MLTLKKPRTSIDGGDDGEGADDEGDDMMLRGRFAACT